MAVAATLERTNIEYDLLAINVRELEPDTEARQRAARLIGAAALGTAAGTVELSSIERPIESLRDAIQAAAEGDPVGRRMVETNVATDVIERTIKTGHVMRKTPLVMTREGKIMQHGQTMDSIQANSLRFAAEHPIMRARTEAEVRNTFSIEQLWAQSMFDTHSFVVFSRAEDLPEAGFFTDTMSVSIQVTSKQDSGLALETAFVSGVTALGGRRHDAETIVQLGQTLGVNFAGKSPAEIIDTPLLIPNELIKHGVIDLVQMYDAAAGGTFFGEKRSVQNYQEYHALCYKREASFAPQVQSITNELVGAAALMREPMDAVRLLHDLSELHMVDRAIVDTSIESRVFGREASYHIEQARAAYEIGDTELVSQSRERAIATANSASCPSSIKTAEDKKGGDSADCDFISKKCPMCNASNVKTKVRSLKISGRKRISGSCGCVKIA